MLDDQVFLKGGDSVQLAIADLRRAVGPVTEKQAQLARWAGKCLPEGVPQIVAGAILRGWLWEHLGASPGARPNLATRDTVSELAAEANYGPRPDPSTRDEAEAYIDYFYRKRRLEALERLSLRPGDIVRVKGSEIDDVDVVSSVARNGAVFFRGRGARSWPDLLEVVARVGDSSEEAQRHQRIAANRASQRTLSTWSVSKEKELKPWMPLNGVQDEDLEKLEEAIETSADEAPIQKLLQRRPQLLAALLRGPTRFVRPQVQLSDRYRADFMVADVDSTGIRWVYVELETPHSGICLQTKQEFDHVARHGLAQIESWREWVQSNLDHARRPRADNGLSLFGVRPHDDGLLLVGRRHLLCEGHDVVRRRIWESQRVHIRTYDWLLEQIRSAVQFKGVPAANRFLLPRPDDS